MARRLARAAEYEELKRWNLLDAGAVGVLGALIAYVSKGYEAAEGLVVGAIFGSIYLSLLHRDVDAFGTEGGGTPLDTLRPGRILRLLVPLFMVLALAAQAALQVGVDVWLQTAHWEAGKNFVGVVPSAEVLYGAVLGYVASTITLRFRGLISSVPEAQQVVAALPGSVGVTLRLVDEGTRQRKEAREAEQKERRPAVPVLLISGPRGCGKTTLAKRILATDPRFSEAKWIATPGGGSVSDGRRIIETEAFEEMEESGALAVSYQPYGDDGEQVSVGLEAKSVLRAAKKSGACLLDVDPPTARALLSYNWEATIEAMVPKGVVVPELRVVSVWVSLPTLNDVVQRNRERMEAAIPAGGPVVEKQLAGLRSQATTDMEWALTSECFDFTVLNTDLKESDKLIRRAADYCFGDPF